MAKANAANAELAKMQAAWKKAQPKEGFENIPDGAYNAKIEKAFIGKSKAGRLQATFEMKIAGGELSGKTFNRFAGIDTPENLEWLKGDLVKLDVEPPDDITDLPAILDGLAGTYVSVQVKTKGEYANYYFNGVISEDDVEEEETDAEVDFDGMDKDELLAYMKENELEIDGYKKMTEKALRAAIVEATSAEPEEEEEEEEAEEEESETPDFESMDKAELIAYLKEAEYEIEGYKTMKEKALRTAVAEAYEAANGEEAEEEEEDGEEIDLDAMDKAELLAFIKDQELVIKNAKTMKEKDLRTAIEKALAD